MAAVDLAAHPGLAVELELAATTHLAAPVVQTEPAAGARLAAAALPLAVVAAEQVTPRAAAGAAVRRAPLAAQVTTKAAAEAVEVAPAILVACPQMRQRKTGSSRATVK